MTKFQINQTYGHSGTRWVWSLVIQQGHVYHISKSFLTLERCLDDISDNGMFFFKKAEAQLSAMNG